MGLASLAIADDKEKAKRPSKDSKIQKTRVLLFILSAPALILENKGRNEE